MSYVHPFQTQLPTLHNSSDHLRFIKLPLLKKPVTPVQHLVLAELLHRSNGKAHCYIGTEALADAMYLEPRRVKRALAALVDRELIARLRRDKQTSVTAFPTHDQFVMQTSTVPSAITLPKSLYYAEQPDGLMDYADTFEFSRLPDHIRLGDYSSEQKVVWAAMAHYVGKDGYAIRRLKDVSDLTSLTVRRVQQVAKSLDEAGLTKRLHRPDRQTAITLFPGHPVYEHAVPATIPADWLCAVPVEEVLKKSVPRYEPQGEVFSHAPMDKHVVRYTDFAQRPTKEQEAAYQGDDKVILPFMYGMMPEAEGLGMEFHDNLGAVEAYRHFCGIGSNRLDRKTYAPVLSDVDTVPMATFCTLILNHMAAKDEDWKQTMPRVAWEQPTKIAAHWKTIREVAKAYATEALGWDVRTTGIHNVTHLSGFRRVRKRHVLKSIQRAYEAVGRGSEEWESLLSGELAGSSLYDEMSEAYGQSWANDHLETITTTQTQGATQ